PYCSARRAIFPGLHRVGTTERIDAFGVDVLESRQVDQLTVVEEYPDVPRAAQSECAGRDNVEHWLGVGLGATDRTQHFTRGRLPGERPGQLCVAHLKLLEQPDVLDGDDGLVREGLEQLDFAFVIGLHMSSRDSDRPNHHVLSSYGHNEGALI